MKLKKIPTLNSTLPLTSEENKFSEKNALVRNIGNQLILKPNPPTREAVKRAKFKDKTYHWNSGLRLGNKRVAT